MFYPTLERLLNASSSVSIYKLVIMAAKRGLELADGNDPLIEAKPWDKPTTVALREILEGKLEVESL